MNEEDARHLAETAINFLHPTLHGDTESVEGTQITVSHSGLRTYNVDYGDIQGGARDLNYTEAVNAIVNHILEDIQP